MQCRDEHQCAQRLGRQFGAELDVSGKFRQQGREVQIIEASKCCFLPLLVKI